jgi:hypothetical protein
MGVNTMKHQHFFWLVMLAGFFLGGCAPHFDTRMGTAVRAAEARQVADPAASDRADAGTGLDGRAGANGMERYEQDFKGTKQSTAPTLLLGTASATGK